MNNNTTKHNRHSIRIKKYDYSQTGAYFVTICVQDKRCLFGKIINHELILNEYGRIVENCWYETEKYFQNITLDQYIIMPNHFHGIIIINNCRGGVTPPLRCYDKQKPTLGNIIAYFKYQSTKQINILRNTPGAPVWQRNYYEHIVRDDKDLNEIREYVVYNYLKWGEDDENPDNVNTGKKHLFLR